MAIFLYYLFSWLIFIVLLLVLFLLFLWMWSNITSKVPFISVPNKTLKEIEKIFELNDDSIVYDLGSGDGRVLFYLYKKHPKCKYIGIENSAFPLLLSNVRKWWFNKINKSNIQIIEKDFFEVDLSDATHIFTYLYPNIMDDLLPKLDQELKPGTRLVSASFHFTTKREISMIDLERSKYQLAKRLYIYEF